VNRTARRVDQWLWFARFFKSRTGAAKFCLAGRLRVNAAPVAKASHAVKAGDVLTFFVGGRVRVVRVVALGSRRGPPEEARALYQDLDPPPRGLAGRNRDFPQY
jgi:ribosome-associated heat shock protein Hsp15